MHLPSDRKQRLLAAFDSYCKRVLQTRGSNIRKRRPRYAKCEILTDDPQKYIQATPEAISKPDFFTLRVGELVASINHYGLYRAMQELKKRQLIVLLLKFWYDFKDEEIAEYLGVTDRTVRNLEKRAFHQIKEHFDRRYA